jgi:multiple antibiotic resistance protein
MGPAYLNSFIYEFVTLFVILDPVATVPLFITVTAGLTQRRSLAVAGAAIGIAFLVLLFFIVGGQFLLAALKIPMASFQLAGSLVLLLFGLKMVLGKVYDEVRGLPKEATVMERAIYPLAIPGIAGPGAILTVVLLTDYNVRTFAEQAVATGILAICLGGFFLLYAASGLIFRLLGPPGIQIVSRVFGLILCSIAVHGLVVAIKLSFNLPA